MSVGGRVPIRVVLARTEGPRNAGLALRAAVNFAPVELILCAPRHPRILEDRQFREMAHGVGDPERMVGIASDLGEALAECAWCVGFSARMRQHEHVEVFDDAAATALRRRRARGDRLALVFGNESDGLSAAEIAPLQQLFRVPTAPEQPSINLGACVSIVLSRLYSERVAPAPSRKNRPLSAEERERLTRHLEREFAPRMRGRAAREAIQRSIRRVFLKAPLETRDAQAWHRLARELGRTRGGPDPEGRDSGPGAAS